MLRYIVRFAGRASHSLSLRTGQLGGVLLLALLLVACGGDGGTGVQEDRRYATDPEPAPTEVPASPTSTRVATVDPPRATASIASPEATPVPVQSQMSKIYSLIEGNVVVADVHTGQSHVVTRSDDRSQVMLIAPLADGSAVAVIRQRSGETPHFDLKLVAPDGSTRGSWTDISSVLGNGSGKFRGELAADWDHEGRRLAVIFPDGGGVVVHLGGIAEILLTREQAPAPLEVAWSPDGEAIAFTSRELDSDGPYLAIGGVRVLPLDPVRINGTGGQRPVHQLVWQPNGEALFAIQGSAGQPDAIGGDLIRIDRRSLTASFAMGGSRFGPRATIVAAEPSPDGASLAIVTVAPGPAGGLQAAVWSVEPVTPVITRLDLGENPPVSGVAWTTAGLTVSLLDENQVTLANFAPDGTPIDVSIPAASPEASPEVPSGTPIVPPIAATASPVASPNASPES